MMKFIINSITYKLLREGWKHIYLYKKEELQRKLKESK